MTEKIQVLSYRLYHAPKVSFENLRPDDSVSKMRGIGSLYAKRFQSLGIERIAQLAAINVNTLGEEGIKKLLGNLRKDRGAMTLAKLNEYVQQV
jgi:predicted flap endonuclease-1-like 5' DNA nuclease